MLRLIQLSSEPECFTPILFQSGVNLILGERAAEKNAQGRKVNGVGKSICIEFLHFALCRSYLETRISKIPKDVLPVDLVVILDLTIGVHRLQIRRTIADPDHPTISTGEGVVTQFERLADVNTYLGELLTDHHENAGQISFRQLMSLLMRDERSGFKSFINPHDASLRIPDDIAPHLYLLGIDLSTYRNLKLTIEQLAAQKRTLAELKRVVTEHGKLKLSDIPSKLNEDRDAARNIGAALDTLRADPAFERVEDELVRLESDLALLRTKRKGLSFQIDQIRSIPLPETIDASDLKIVYDRIKSGLGSLVERSLDEARFFKSEIESFQKVLRDEELTTLEAIKRDLSTEIRRLSDEHSSLSRQLDNKGALAELKTGLEIATRRADEYHRLNAQYQQFQEKQFDVESMKTARTNDLNALALMLSECKNIEQSLNDTIVAFHSRIMQSSRASFRFQLKNTPAAKRPLSFDLRIQDDGSKSIDQVRVFIYDLAVMFDPLSRVNHPGFLVHDNILEVDQDTLTRCLNFLHFQIEAEDEFQYILTLNRDKIEGEEIRHDIRLDIDASKVASFTKAAQFLRTRYSEL